MRKVNKPYYPYKPIHSIKCLSKVLGFSPEVLLEVAASADKFYRPGKKIEKKGKVRPTLKTIGILKKIQISIKKNILNHVYYPHYQMGGLKSTDYMLNAKKHINSKVIISLDIESFFPSSKASIIYKIWRNFFKFSEEVSDCLTALTTHNGMLPQTELSQAELPQGVPTSSQLANLIFFESEPKLYEILKEQGYTYTRFVDDISISAYRKLDKKEKTEVISQVYKMLFSYQLKPKRVKTKVATNNGQMKVNNLNVTNKSISCGKSKKLEIRSGIFESKKLFAKGEYVESCKKIRSAIGKINTIIRTYKLSDKPMSKRLIAQKKEIAHLMVLLAKKVNQ